MQHWSHLGLNKSCSCSVVQSECKTNEGHVADAFLQPFVELLLGDGTNHEVLGDAPLLGDRGLQGDYDSNGDYIVLRLSHTTYNKTDSCYSIGGHGNYCTSARFSMVRNSSVNTLTISGESNC